MSLHMYKTRAVFFFFLLFFYTQTYCFLFVPKDITELKKTSLGTKSDTDRDTLICFFFRSAGWKILADDQGPVRQG